MKAHQPTSETPRPPARNLLDTQPVLHHDKAMIQAVASSLARQDGKFISAADWAGITGKKYRDQAKAVLRTIQNVQDGNHTGGLPPRT